MALTAASVAAEVTDSEAWLTDHASAINGLVGRAATTYREATGFRDGTTVALAAVYAHAACILVEAAGTDRPLVVVQLLERTGIGEPTV